MVSLQDFHIQFPHLILLYDFLCVFLYDFPVRSPFSQKFLCIIFSWFLCIKYFYQDYSEAKLGLREWENFSTVQARKIKKVLEMREFVNSVFKIASWPILKVDWNEPSPIALMATAWPFMISQQCSNLILACIRSYMIFLWFPCMISLPRWFPYVISLYDFSVLFSNIIFPIYVLIWLSHKVPLSDFSI